MREADSRFFYFDTLKNVRVQEKCKGSKGKYQRIKVTVQGELLITIMSSLAQEESRSISENTTWGKRKQFAEGKTSVGYSAFLGYDKDFKINEDRQKM